MTTTRPLGHQQKSLLAYIAKHPGCSSLEARRNACSYPQGWSNAYSDYSLTRLRRRGLVIAEANGNKLSLTVA